MTASWVIQLLALLVSAPAGTHCDRARYFLLNRHLDAGYLDSCDVELAADTGEASARLEVRTRLLLVRCALTVGRDRKLGLALAAGATAESLLGARPDSPMSHVWWAAAHGTLLQLRGSGAAALGAGALRKENLRALELDPNCALASFALGRMYEELPGLLGGGPRKAETWFRRGVASDPNYTVIRLSLARVLARQGRRQEALDEIGRILSVTDPTNPAETILEDQPAARDLLAQLGVCLPSD